MAVCKISGIKLTGLVSVLPAEIKNNNELTDCFGKAELEKIIASTGIQSRRVMAAGQTSLTLAEIASKALIEDSNSMAEDIGLVLFVTQTPDMPFPGNAVQLQKTLGLSKNTLAFDVNLGCSGFVYGLWQAAQLLKGIEAPKALLITGDSTSRQYSDDNRVVNTLFGDAVSACLVEKARDAPDMVFSMGSDGAGAPYLQQPNGGALHPDTQANMFMDGTQVFVFTLREIPGSVKDCLDTQDWQIEELDFAVMHQANEMMLQRLGDKLKLSKEQLVICLKDTGNTSSASIPLAMNISLEEELLNKDNKLLLSGFGVGWSWGTVALELPKLKVCSLIDLAKGT